MPIILIAVLVFIVLMMYNSLIRKRNAVRNVRSTTDVLLKKRYDLIPNLVSAVKGYAKHEQSVLAEITELRAKALAAPGLTRETGAINDRLTALLPGILGLAENYPDLKASANFLNLQKNLTEVEEQISAARRAYSSTVTDYNTAIATVPRNIIAGLFGFQPEELFSIASDQREPVSVKFDKP